MKHVSDSERLTRAILNKKETELYEAKRTINEYKRQLEAMSEHITSLKESNKILCSQVQYLVSKHTQNA